MTVGWREDDEYTVDRFLSVSMDDQRLDQVQHIARNRSAFVSSSQFRVGVEPHFPLKIRKVGAIR